MNRIIKFRAWDGEKMVTPNSIDRKGIAWWIENSIPESSRIVMQFTGLTDKNGTEIYEGDITQITQVKGNGLDSFGRIVVRTVEFSPYSGWCGIGRIDRMDRGIDEIEIIGNIHSNPELICT